VVTGLVYDSKKIIFKSPKVGDTNPEGNALLHIFILFGSGLRLLKLAGPLYIIEEKIIDPKS